MQEHAKLSASGSHRWINCPGCIKAEEGFPDTTNKYAEEGKLAHQLAESILGNFSLPPHLVVSEEMMKAVGKYVEYLENHAEKSYLKMVEKKVDFSYIVPEGFGTVDIILYKDLFGSKELQIIDFKYGIGNKIEAKENSQLLLYALGATQYLISKGILGVDDICSIKMHIAQPRRDHYDVWEITFKELKEWGEYLKIKANEALDPDAPRIPSELACQYCKANATCPALNKIATEVIKLSTNDKITLEETKFIMDNNKIVINFLNKVEENIYNRLISGTPFPGYKLVKGRNMRKVNPDKEELLVEILGEKAYNKSLVGIGQLEKILDNKILNSLLYTSTSSPILTKENDKRIAINLDELKFNPVDA